MYKGVRFGLKPHTEGVRTLAKRCGEWTKSDFLRIVLQVNYDLSVQYFNVQVHRHYVQQHDHSTV